MEEIDDGITGRLTVFGSDSLINDAINSTFTNLDNLTLFTSAVTVDFDDISSLSIEPVSLETPTNTISTGRHLGTAADFPDSRCPFDLRLHPLAAPAKL